MERIGPHFAGDLAHRDVATVVRIIDEDAVTAAGGTRSAEGIPPRTSEFDTTPATGEVTIRLS
ncbi:MAG: hypothetical protein Q4C87_12175 [Actinomycetaceae bacterium]|nr:hypothetical protein [Actinomycetaceae bacterium]